jgi:hypothetical protein
MMRALAPFAVCIILVGAAFGEDESAPRQTYVDAEIKRSVAVRDHMKRVQDFFDNNNHPSWHRLAFVASVLEIRERRASDNLIGELEGGDLNGSIRVYRGWRSKPPQ